MVCDDGSWLTVVVRDAKRYAWIRVCSRFISGICSIPIRVLRGGGWWWVVVEVVVVGGWGWWMSGGWVVVGDGGWKVVVVVGWQVCGRVGGCIGRWMQRDGRARAGCGRAPGSVAVAPWWPHNGRSMVAQWTLSGRYSGRYSGR